MSLYEQVMPFSERVNRELARYYLGVPMMVASVAAMLAWFLFIFLVARTNVTLLEAISPHVSTLVETNDRTDLERLVRSVAGKDEQNSAIHVIKDGHVEASSGSFALLDRTFIEQSGYRVSERITINLSSLIVKVPVTRPKAPARMNAWLVMETPMGGVLKQCAKVGWIIMILGLLAAYLLGKRVGRAVGRVIEPMSEVDQMIRDMASLRAGRTPLSFEASTIVEVANIRRTILQTQDALIQGKDAEALVRAKELTAEAYRRLIHDLHTPVAALRNFLTIVGDERSYSEADRDTARREIPILAEDILSQVIVAKEHLSLNEVRLESRDLRQCVAEAVEQAKYASPKGSEIMLDVKVPEQPQVIAHDPVLLRRAVVNLVMNALEASTKRVSVLLQEAAKGIVIQVTDDGPGLRADEATSHLQGRGRSTKGDRPSYGLAGANHIVRSHGGKIIYRPANGGGAAFEVRI